MRDHNGQVLAYTALAGLATAIVFGMAPAWRASRPDVMQVLHTSPGLEDLWQMHFSQLSGQEYTVPSIFIANMLDDPFAVMPMAPIDAPPLGSNAPPPPVHNGPAYWIKVNAQTNGTFTVTNARNGFAKTYRAKGRAGTN